MMSSRYTNCIYVEKYTWLMKPEQRAVFSYNNIINSLHVRLDATQAKYK